MTRPPSQASHPDSCRSSGLTEDGVLSGGTEPEGASGTTGPIVGLTDGARGARSSIAEGDALGDDVDVSEALTDTEVEELEEAEAETEVAGERVEV